MLKSPARGATVSWVPISAGPGGKTDLTEETFAHLVDCDELFETGAADVDPGGSAETERRVTRHHGGIRIPRAEACRDVECGRIRDVLLHPRQVGADPQSGDQR